MSLHAAGFDVRTPQTAMVEAQRPGRRPFAKVLAQNAWTVLPAEDYERLSAPYPARWRARMVARRAAATVNIHRAEEVVCLTESMGEVVRSMTRTPVTVARVLAPMDVGATNGHTDDHAEGVDGATVLVPGTITWYKRPQLALQTALDLGKQLGQTPAVFFAGRDDGTGAWAATQQEARRLDLQVAMGPLTRSEMVAALRSSMATIVPSELESLSLSLSEALILSPRVVASSLAVHREISAALGRTPEWLETWLPHDVPPGPAITVSADETRAAWRYVGKALQLPERTEEGHIS